jgi:cytochrome c oxidase cbb3-type subunit 3
MSAAVGIFITVAALGNIAAVLWLIWWTARGSAKLSPQQTTHVWDEDLTEYNNPLPRWWLWLFLLSIAFGLAYLAWYPGLGRFAGLGHWTEVKQYSQEAQTAQAALEQRFAAFKDKSLLELAKDPGAMATAKNLFALNCSTCHGSDARGAKGFPNLTDHDWLWGGSEENVYQTIAQGRDAVMPPWGAVLGHDGVEKVLAYVLSLSGRSAETPASPEMLAAGKQTFTTICAACHGADGKGNPLLGAPNLTDKVWLHGGSVADIRETITNGRTNKMPAHLERLGETRVRLLAAYVLSLSQPAPAAPDPVVAQESAR